MSASYWLVTPTELEFPTRRKQDSGLFKLPLRLLAGNSSYRGFKIIDARHAIVTDRSFLFQDASGYVWLVERQARPVDPRRPEQWLVAADDDNWRACLVVDASLGRYFVERAKDDNGTLAVDAFGNRLINFCGTKSLNVSGGRIYHETGKCERGPATGFGPLGQGYIQGLSSQEYFGW